MKEIEPLHNIWDMSPTEIQDWLGQNIYGKYIVDESELLEVYDYIDGETTSWNTEKEHSSKNKAYLIGIQPIKQESCADICRKFIELWDDYEGIDNNDAAELYKRAKAAISRGAEHE